MLDAARALARDGGIEGWREACSVRRMRPASFVLVALGLLHSGCCFGGGPYELHLGRDRAAGLLRCPLKEVTLVDTESHAATFAGCGRSIRMLQHCEFSDVGCSWSSEDALRESMERYRRSLHGGTR